MVEQYGHEGDQYCCVDATLHDTGGGHRRADRGFTVGKSVGCRKTVISVSIKSGSIGVTALVSRKQQRGKNCN